jgi:Na+(H+)/acetate symporter ActP
MDIYLAIGFAPLVFGLFALSWPRAVRYLIVIASALALSGCLSLKLGNNDKPQLKAGQSAGPVDVANSMAEAPGR